MITTRYLIYTSASQSLLALGFVTELSPQTVNITILPVDLIRMENAPPLLNLKTKLSEDCAPSDTHENLCTALLLRNGIPAEHQLKFFLIPSPESMD